MGKRKTERGQSLLELAVILPVLLILLMGLVEVGYALRDYLIVVNAAREGCRFAARGRFSPESVGARVVSAGGIVRVGNPAADVPFLRTYGSPDPNTGIIATYIPMDSEGNVTSTISSDCSNPAPIAVTHCYSGVLPSGAGGVRAILAGDSKVSLARIVERHGPSTASISAMREAAGYERMSNHIVVVEVFFMHHPLWNNPFVPLPDPWMMHAQTEMRVVTDRGTLQ
jgi:hypothetical protein